MADTITIHVRRGRSDQHRVLTFQLKAKYGVLPDSTPEIRRAREELLTHLDEGSNP